MRDSGIITRRRHLANDKRTTAAAAVEPIAVGVDNPITHRSTRLAAAAVAAETRAEAVPDEIARAGFETLHINLIGVRL